MYFFSDILSSAGMKLGTVVALFLIGVIPVKMTLVYSQSELHWGARGSGRPPKISQLINKSDSPQLVIKLPYPVSIIDQSPAEIPRPKLTTPRMSDNSKGSSRLGMSIQFMSLMHLQILDIKATFKGALLGAWGNKIPLNFAGVAIFLKICLVIAHSILL